MNNNDIIDKQKKKRSLFFPIIKFTLFLVVIGVVIYNIVPSVFSKQSIYVSIAKNLMTSVGNFVERDDIKAKDTNTTYYIPTSCVEFKEEQTTPYGYLSEAYVIVTYSGNVYNYYWVSKDSKDYGVNKIKSYKDLSPSDIKPNIYEIDTNIGIDNKENIIVYNSDCTKVEKKLAYSFYDSKTGLIKENKLIDFVNQQNKGKISIGDEIVIGGKEHFYVVTTNKNETTLIAKYNLYVGYKLNISEETGYSIVKKISKNDNEYGRQSSKTTEEGVGVVPFSAFNYWNKDKKKKDIYNGSIYNEIINKEEPIVKETTDIVGISSIKASINNYTVAYYLEPYLKRLEKYGLVINEGRLLTREEATGLNCSKELNCRFDKNEWLMNTSFWLSTVDYNGSITNNIDVIEKNGLYTSKKYNSVTTNGIRPVIIINNSYLLNNN